MPAAVISERDRSTLQLPRGAGSYRIPIDDTTGSKQLVQRVVALEPGRSPQLFNQSSEDVRYVVRGRGTFETTHLSVPVQPGSAMLAPAWTAYKIINEGPIPLALLSVVSPQPDSARVRPDWSGISWDTPWPETVPPAITHEAQEEALPSGDDRYFKLLIDPRYGAKHVTQFVGFIDRSRAPFHTHTYEEAIYILEGEGIVHIEGHADAPIRPGTSIFLPPGTPHCLENASDGVLKLLGVFSPPGSPASKVEDRPSPGLHAESRLDA